jgi:dipeptide/tripeptide permease
MVDAFTFLSYATVSAHIESNGQPKANYKQTLFAGWLADKHLGRFKTICIGVAVCGVAHIIMIISAIPSILQAGNGIGPFALSLYMLAIGAALFKPNIAPTVLDQNPHKRPHVITNKNGEKVIVDPEATSESIMLVSSPN